MNYGKHSFLDPTVKRKLDVSDLSLVLVSKLDKTDSTIPLCLGDSVINFLGRNKLKTPLFEGCSSAGRALLCVLWDESVNMSLISADSFSIWVNGRLVSNARQSFSLAIGDIVVFGSLRCVYELRHCDCPAQEDAFATSIKQLQYHDAFPLPEKVLLSYVYDSGDCSTLPIRFKQMDLAFLFMELSAWTELFMCAGLVENSLDANDESLNIKLYFQNFHLQCITQNVKDFVACSPCAELFKFRRQLLLPNGTESVKLSKPMMLSLCDDLHQLSQYTGHKVCADVCSRVQVFSSGAHATACPSLPYLHYIPSVSSTGQSPNQVDIRSIVNLCSACTYDVATTATINTYLPPYFLLADLPTNGEQSSSPSMPLHEEIAELLLKLGRVQLRFLGCSCSHWVYQCADVMLRIYTGFCHDIASPSGGIAVSVNPSEEEICCFYRQLLTLWRIDETVANSELDTCPVDTCAEFDSLSLLTKIFSADSSYCVECSSYLRRQLSLAVRALIALCVKTAVLKNAGNERVVETDAFVDQFVVVHSAMRVSLALGPTSPAVSGEVCGCVRTGNQSQYCGALLPPQATPASATGGIPMHHFVDTFAKEESNGHSVSYEHIVDTFEHSSEGHMPIASIALEDEMVGRSTVDGMVAGDRETLLRDDISSLAVTSSQDRRCAQEGSHHGDVNAMTVCYDAELTRHVVALGTMVHVPVDHGGSTVDITDHETQGVTWSEIRSPVKTSRKEAAFVGNLSAVADRVEDNDDQDSDDSNESDDDGDGIWRTVPSRDAEDIDRTVVSRESKDVKTLVSRESKDVKTVVSRVSEHEASEVEALPVSTPAAAVDISGTSDKGISCGVNADHNSHPVMCTPSPRTSRLSVGQTHNVDPKWVETSAKTDEGMQRHPEGYCVHPEDPSDINKEHLLDPPNDTDEVEVSVKDAQLVEDFLVQEEKFLAAEVLEHTPPTMKSEDVFENYSKVLASFETSPVFVRAAASSKLPMPIVHEVRAKEYEVGLQQEEIKLVNFREGSSLLKHKDNEASLWTLFYQYVRKQESRSGIKKIQKELWKAKQRSMRLAIEHHSATVDEPTTIMPKDHAGRSSVADDRDGVEDMDTTSTIASMQSVTPSAGGDMVFDSTDREAVKLLTLIPRITLPSPVYCKKSDKISLLSPIMLLHILRDFDVNSDSFCSTAKICEIVNEVHDAKSYPAKEMKDGSVVVNPAVRSTRVFSEKNIVKYLSFLDFCKILTRIAIEAESMKLLNGCASRVPVSSSIDVCEAIVSLLRVMNNSEGRFKIGITSSIKPLFAFSVD